MLKFENQHVTIGIRSFQPKPRQMGNNGFALFPLEIARNCDGIRSYKGDPKAKTRMQFCRMDSAISLLIKIWASIRQCWNTYSDIDKSEYILRTCGYQFFSQQSQKPVISLPQTVITPVAKKRPEQNRRHFIGSNLFLGTIRHFIEARSFDDSKSRGTMYENGLSFAKPLDDLQQNIWPPPYEDMMMSILAERNSGRQWVRGLHPLVARFVFTTITADRPIGHLFFIFIFVTAIEVY